MRSQWVKVKRRDHHLYMTAFSIYEDVVAVKATLLGESKGILYINDLEYPSVAILWNEFDGFYVAVIEPCDMQVIREGIVQILKHNNCKYTEFVVYINPVYDELISDIIPVKTYEQLDVICFSASELKPMTPKWTNTYLVCKLDKDFFNTVRDNIDDVIETIESTWYNMDIFLNMGFGFAIVDQENQSIAAYCVTEHVTEDSAEFSIETLPNYHRQGLGTSVGYEMLKMCLDRGKHAFWYCTSDNEASIQLAKKLGFQKKRAFHVWYFEI